MHYYRYRYGSLLSVKEMMYNEIYFGSPSECNDPFDSKAFYEFPADGPRWRRLLDQALKVNDETGKQYLLDELTKHLCSISPISLEDLFSNSFLDVPSLFDRFQKQTLQNMEIAIRTFVNTYIPASRFFSCFSSSKDETLMWAHYANNHRGFCLVFKSIDNKLKIDERYKKVQIRRKTVGGLAPQMSHSMPDAFEFQSIDYKAEVEPLNAFQNLSAFVFGDTLTEEKNIALRLDQHSHFLQKHYAWHYEKEYRLVLSPPPSWLFGGHIDYTAHERLFRYDPNQLVGIVFGARMPESEKKSLTEIINDMLDRRYDQAVYPMTRFNFITFDAKLSASQRSIEVHPREMLGTGGLKPEDKDFDRLYQEWKDGYGWKRETPLKSEKMHIP